jgi:hypothetical protein
MTPLRTGHEAGPRRSRLRARLDDTLAGRDFAALLPLTLTGLADATTVTITTANP